MVVQWMVEILTNTFFMLMMTGICLTICYVFLRVQIKTQPSTKRLYHGMEIMLFWCFMWGISFAAPTLGIAGFLESVAVAAVPGLGNLMMCYGYLLSRDKCIDKKICIFMSVVSLLEGVVIGTFYGLRTFGVNLPAEIFQILVFVLMLPYGLAFFYFTIQVLFQKIMGHNLRGSYYFPIISATFYVHLVSCMALLERSVQELLCASPLYLTLVFFVIKRYHFYDPVPMLIKEILNYKNTGMIIISNRRDVMDYNGNFLREILGLDQCRSFQEFIKYLKPCVLNPFSVDNLYASLDEMGMNPVTGEMDIQNGGHLYNFMYLIHPLLDRRGNKLATILTFRDITDIVSINRRLEEKNQELGYTNEMLKQHLLENKALTVERERELLMLEISDTLGHSMTEILALLEACNWMLRPESAAEIAEKGIDEVLARVDQGIGEMRRLVSRYMEGLAIHD